MYLEDGAQPPPSNLELSLRIIIIIIVIQAFGGYYARILSIEFSRSWILKAYDCIVTWLNIL